MAYLLGQTIGGAMLIYLLSAAWEFALFKRVMDDPVMGKAASVLAAYLMAATPAGFGGADGGPYYWPGFVLMLPGALIVVFFAVRRGIKIRNYQKEQWEKDARTLEDTFN